MIFNLRVYKNKLALREGAPHWSTFGLDSIEQTMREAIGWLRQYPYVVLENDALVSVVPLKEDGKNQGDVDSTLPG